MDHGRDPGGGACQGRRRWYQGTAEIRAGRRPQLRLRHRKGFHAIGREKVAGIFKAYDVRGIYPSQINEDMARQIGLAFQFVLDEEDRSRGNTVVVSRDMRSHSEPLAKALIEGLTQSGLDVLDIGLATTPMNYFAVGHTKAAGGVQV